MSLCTGCGVGSHDKLGASESTRSPTLVYIVVCPLPLPIYAILAIQVNNCADIPCVAGWLRPARYIITDEMFACTACSGSVVVARCGCAVMARSGTAQSGAG